MGVKFYRAELKASKDEKKEIASNLNGLDWAIIDRIEKRETDIVGIISACKPYVSEGRKVFATTDGVIGSVRKLSRYGIIRRR